MMREKKQLIRIILIFMVSFLVCILVTGSYVRNKIRLDYSQMEHLALVRATKVNHVISTLLFKTQALSALVIQSDGDIQEFEHVAATIVDSPAIRNVILAPNGIVSNVYPLENNESLIGFDYFSDQDGNKEAILARETGELVLGGPFTLMQGGQALVGRLPVYIENEQGQKEFWGLVSVTLNYPQALEGAGLEELKDQGYAYEIRRINPDTNQLQIIAASDYDYNRNARYAEEEFTILNAKWLFRLSPIREWYQYPETWVFLGVGLLISVLITFLCMHNIHLKKMQKDLEYLSNSDFLTGAINRRGGFTALHEVMENPANKFVIGYLDINRFKEINDRYGHHMGDKVLIELSHIIKRNISDKDIFSRLGGDEFTVVLMDLDEVEKAKEIFASVQREFAQASKIFCIADIPFSFSIGYACFPKEADNIDALLELADSNMYKNKEKMKMK